MKEPREFGDMVREVGWLDRPRTFDACVNMSGLTATSIGRPLMALWHWPQSPLKNGLVEGGEPEPLAALMSGTWPENPWLRTSPGLYWTSSRCQRGSFFCIESVVSGRWKTRGTPPGSSAWAEASELMGIEPMRRRLTHTMPKSSLNT